jgi:calcineurin-like phosphoesterase family protein
MRMIIMANHNEVVKKGDTVIHCGDFSFGLPIATLRILEALNGRHIMIPGSHDVPLIRMLKKDDFREGEYEGGIFEYRGRRVETFIKKNLVVADHYCYRVWPRSHYNSWHVFGHSHGKLEPIGKSWDVGVDNNNFYPVSEIQLEKIMSERPDNPDLVVRRINKDLRGD